MPRTPPVAACAPGPTDEELLSHPEQWCRELGTGRSVASLPDMDSTALYSTGRDWETTEEAQEVLVLGVEAY